MDSFILKDNLDLLWEILTSELSINVNNKTLFNKIKVIFDTNISMVSKTSTTSTIMQLNKLFLQQVILAVNKLIPNLKSENAIKSLNISEDILSSPHTFEDIQQGRRQEFDSQVDKRRKEFDELINPPQPRMIEFADKVEDYKTTSIDELISRRSEPIDPLLKDFKRVTFEEDVSAKSNDIFSKLKPKSNQISKKYDEQVSIALPIPSVEPLSIDISSSSIDIQEQFDKMYKKMDMIQTTLDAVLKIITPLEQSP